MKYSVVIPVYNSEALVEKTVAEVCLFFEAEGSDFEIILVNDSSPDGSWEIIKQLAEQDSRLVAINLLKNYGQHNAVLCGFQVSTGDRVITMDDDGQNPASEIRLLIQKMDEGYDCVFGRFKEKKHGFVRRLGSKLINYLNGKVFAKPDHIVLTNFRMIKKEIVIRIREYNTSFPYIPGLILMFSNKIGNVLVEHKPRAIGKSNYNLVKILQLVSRLLINYSAFPLRVMTGTGITLAAFSFLFGVVLVFKRLIMGSSVEGWTSIVVIVSFFNGFTILMLGLIGDYLSRILRQISFAQSYQILEIVKHEQ